MPGTVNSYSNGGHSGGLHLSKYSNLFDPIFQFGVLAGQDLPGSCTFDEDQGSPEFEGLARKSLVPCKPGSYMGDGYVRVSIADVFNSAGIIPGCPEIGAVYLFVVRFYVVLTYIIGAEPVYPGGVRRVIFGETFRVMAIPGIFVVFDQLTYSTVFFGSV